MASLPIFLNLNQGHLEKVRVSLTSWVETVMTPANLPRTDSYVHL